MLAKNQKLSFIIEFSSIELLESYPHPCYFEVIFLNNSQISEPIPSPSPLNPLLISLNSKFTFEIPANPPQETPQLIQIKLRETCNKKKIAFNQLDLKLLHLPYHEWIPLSNKIGLQARLLINMVYSSSGVSEVSEQLMDFENPDVLDQMVKKPLQLGRGTSWIDTKVKENKLDYYQKKAYFFGDDLNPLIFSFDFFTDSLELLETPDNLQLMGYSMSVGLPNGKIIIAGGINHNLNIIVPTVYCFDPVKNKARVLSSMLQARYTHNLVQKGTYIYALGGRYYGKGTVGVLNQCEKYNLNNNTWTAIAPLIMKRCTSVTYIQGNYIYIAGGYQGANRLNSIEKYDEENDKWETCSFNLSVALEAGSGLMISDDEGLYIGGQDDVAKSDKILMLNFKKNKCSQVGNMKTGRVLSHSYVINKKLYIFGGTDYDWERIDLDTWKGEMLGSYQGIVQNELKNFASCMSCDYFDEKLPFGEKIVIFGVKDQIFVFDKEKKKIENKQIPKNLKIFEGKQICLMPNGYILIAGGVDSAGFANKTSYLYDPLNNSGFIGASMVNGKWSHSLIHYKGFIYSIGGYIKTKKPTNLCEKYNIKANKWEEIEGLIEKRAQSYVIQHENNIFCFGGIGENESIILSIEKYEIQDDSWKLIEVNMPLFNPYFATFQENNAIYFLNPNDKQTLIFSINEQIFEKKDISPVFQFNLSDNSLMYCLSPKESLIFSLKSSNISVISCNETNQSEIASFPLIEGSIIVNEMVNQAKSEDLCKNIENLMISEKNEEKESIFYEEKKSSEISTKPLIKEEILAKLQICNTLKYPKTFTFIDEISLYQDIERNSRLMIFSSNDANHSVLEFNMKTESFEMHKLSFLASPMAFFKYSQSIGLPDGKILITGGLYSSELGVSVVNSAFLYNPYNKSLKPGHPMNGCRFQHTITGSNRFVYCMGGKKFYTNSKLGVLNTCERYDIREDHWEELPSMEEGVFNGSSCIIEKNLYVFGGNNGVDLVKTIQMLDKIKLIWMILEVSLPKGIENIGVIALGYHEILLCGGHITDCSINDVYLFDIAQPNLQVLPSMLHTRNNPKLAAFGKNVYVLGGNSVFSSEKAWFSNAKKLKWETLSSYEHLISNDLVELSYGISRMDLDSLKIDHFSENLEGNASNNLTFDKLYIFGTESFPYILRLKFPSLIWEKFAKPENLKLWDYSMAITLPNGSIMLTGGINSSLSDIKKEVYVFSVSGNSFQAKEQPNLLQARYTHTMCYLNNYVYVMGGRYFGAGVAGVLNQCERFNLMTKEWKQIGSLNMKSCTAVATTYLNKVYIFGGYRGDGRNKHIERYNELTNIWENVPLLLNNPIEAEVLIPLSGHEFVMLGGKDDFTEQKYVIVYDLEIGSVRKEKDMKYPRILCKVAKFNDRIYVIGGHADKTCEMAKVGEWEWKEFEGYEKLLESGLDKASLVKNTFAQSF